MKQCQWSQNGLCQIYRLKNTDTKPSCDGLKDRKCLGNYNLDDIRDRQAKAEAAANHPGWGGKRDGAGAPRGNLNRLVHGRDSKLIRRAVEKLAEDPELRAFLLLIARAATTGEIAETTRQNIIRVLGDRPLRRQAATIRLKRMREGVSHES